MGNQMFQYAYALNPRATIYLNGYLHPFSSDKRQLSLHHFQLSKETHVASLPLSIYLICRFLLSCLMIGGPKIIWELMKKKKLAASQYATQLYNQGLYYTADGFFIPAIKKTAGIKHLYGYFQSPAIVENIQETLREAFQIITPPSTDNQALLKEIQSQNAVCLHVRRGDYGLYPQYQVCNEAFYQTAVQQASKQLENPVFYIFSTGHTDVQWVRKHYHFDANVHYVDLDNPDYEELRLMTACKHFIISNSTFSWWAAVLSNSAGESKKVWAPKHWFVGSNVTMCPHSWTLV